MIGSVIVGSILSIEIMLDVVAPMIQRGCQVGLAGEGSDDREEVEVCIDACAHVTVVTIVGAGVACQEEGGQGHGPDCPDLPTRSFCRIHQFVPPSFDCQFVRMESGTGQLHACSVPAGHLDELLQGKGVRRRSGRCEGR